MLVEGKVAVVTGSSRGLGAAFARGLAAEGAAVVVNGTSAEGVAQVVAEIEGAGGRAVGCVESVATLAGARRIIQTALDSFGRLDILVNNAGILRDRTLLKMTEEEWDTVIGTHLKGAWACSKFAAETMSRQRSGRIVFITSGAAWVPGIGQSNYAAAKGGMLSMAWALALELSRYNITVNAVWPRALTRMTEGLAEGRRQNAREEGRRTGAPVATELDLGLGDPSVVAPLVVYLASDEAGDITGRLFSFTGGTLIVWSPPQETARVTVAGGWSLDEIRKRLRPMLRG